MRGKDHDYSVRGRSVRGAQNDGLSCSTEEAFPGSWSRKMTTAHWFIVSGFANNWMINGKASWYTRRNTSFVSLAEHLPPPRMESEEEEEDVRGVGHLETGRTTVRVREGRGVVSERQPLCHRGRAARRWRAIARILFPHNYFYDNDDRRGIVKKSGRCFFQWSRSATSCLLVLLLLPYLASARPGSDATAASGGN